MSYKDCSDASEGAYIMKRLVILIIGLFALSTMVAQDNDPSWPTCPLVNPSEGRAPGYMLMKPLQVLPPECNLFPNWNEDETPVPLAELRQGLAMDIVGQAGDWGLLTETKFPAQGCIEIRVGGDFYVNAPPDDSFNLVATLWDPGFGDLTLTPVSVMQPGGSEGTRWIVSVPNHHDLFLRVAIIAEQPTAAEGTVIEWYWIAVGNIGENICERWGVPIYPYIGGDDFPTGTGSPNGGPVFLCP